MKYISLILILAFISCKPEIYNILYSPDFICSCQPGDVRYQLKNADRSWVEITPGIASPAGIEMAVGEAGQQIARFTICDNATISIFAENSKGTSVATRQVRRAGPIEPLHGMLNPFCFGNRFEAWEFTPSRIHDEPSVIPINSRLSEIIINVDRPGTFVYDEISVPINPGINHLLRYTGMSPFRGNYWFRAALNPNEQCIESGTTLPSGARRPPSFSIDLITACP
ncbi:MAG: hypothetical protein IPO16_02845 [Saprospiraceae bacterium]|nr:hypothetical protein [Saprospiraceae bacterium]